MTDQLTKEKVPVSNPFDKALAVFAGKKSDGYLLKCWFETQEDLDAAFDLVNENSIVIPMQQIEKGESL